MTLLAAENISKKFNDQVIVEKVSFTIQPNDRIGLVGKNGSGKTTLFDMLTAQQDPDSGCITKSKATIIDYAEQEKEEYLNLTLYEFVASARQDLLHMRKEIIELEELLTINPGNSKAVEQLGSLHTKYEHEGGFNYENEVKTILTGLSFDSYRYNDRVANFSGGEKNRAGLAKILAGKGNLLLLDEPTNHLDIESTKWLEDYLSKTDKAYLVVSHDRTFLNKTVSKVWEILNGRIDFYTGSFEHFLRERSERKRLHQHKYKHQQERIAQLEDFVRRHMAGQKTKQAQSKLKFLSRIKRLPPPESEGRGPTIKLATSGRSYAHIVEASNVTVGYGDTEIVSNIKFDIYRGDKIGIIGANGSGKSTLLKTLIGEIEPVNGELKLGNNVTVAYFDQELSDLDTSKSVLENIWELDPMVEVGVMRSFLGKFGFSGEDSLKMVSTLSGGEKTKLSLARLLYHPANFIIFDEPTNHLDIVSREALEEALNAYDGSFLVVSHDRYFLDKVAKKIFYVNNGHLAIYDGNYSFFEEKNQPVEYKQASVPSASKSKQNFREFKEKSKQKSKIKKEIQATEQLIESREKTLESLIDHIQNKISHADWEKLQATTEEKQAIEEELLQLYDKLEKLQEIEFD